MKKIIMLTGGGDSSTFMYNGLKDEFNITHVIIEQPLSKKKLIKGRIRKLGFFTVIGQLLFQVGITKIINIFSKKRIQNIVESYQLDSTPIPENIAVNVTSVNSKFCREFLINENPDLIIVNGTRIISKKVLGSTNATFINTHAGITPKYRGVHGGYWAVANNDLDNCGVTVHLVDEGIDTGGVLYQATINPSKNDNFSTYPYLQIGEGIKIMKNAISDFNVGKLRSVKPKTSDSKLWYHPTIWYYLKKRIFKGVK